MTMGRSNKVCPECGRKMKCLFNGLQYCKCGMSWSRHEGYFHRTDDMVFCLKRVKKGKGPKTKQVPVIRYKDCMNESSSKQSVEQEE